MKTLLAIILLLSPAGVEFVTRADGWNYPQGDTTTIELLHTFKVTKDTSLYLNGNVVVGKDICVACGDKIERFKLDSTQQNFTAIAFVRPLGGPKACTLEDFKLGGDK